LETCGNSFGCLNFDDTLIISYLVALSIETRFDDEHTVGEFIHGIGTSW